MPRTLFVLFVQVQEGEEPQEGTRGQATTAGVGVLDLKAKLGRASLIGMGEVGVNSGHRQSLCGDYGDCIKLLLSCADTRLPVFIFRGIERKWYMCMRVMII